MNISRVHFKNINLAKNIKEIIDKNDIPYEIIELELTESDFFDDKDVLYNTVDQLKNMGFVISMDDFGGGFSSLNSLKDLPLDVVKLDGDFFRNIKNEDKGKTVIRDTINLVRNLNMKTVAEGIETKDQVDFLIDNNINLIQGYYFDRPMPVEEFEIKAYPERENQSE